MRRMMRLAYTEIVITHERTLLAAFANAYPLAHFAIAAGREYLILLSNHDKK